MRYLITLIITSFLFVLQLFALDTKSSARLPELEIETSRFINITCSSLQLEKSIAMFSGKFIVLGKGIYGHFEAILYADSSKIINQIKTEDRAWRGDQGANIKSVEINLSSIDSCKKVVVFFRETRVE